jgi:aminopeptidase N
MKKTLIIWLGLVSLLAALVPSGSSRAQALDDWTAVYRPAMLPDFAGDMAAYADAPRYTIDAALTVTPDGAALAGEETVIYTNRTAGALAEIVFRLYPNLESYGGEMVVDQVTADGVSIAPALDATRSILSLMLPQPLAPGSSVTLALHFATTVTAGFEGLYRLFSDLDDILALPNAYPVLSVYTPGEGWWQVTDHPQGDAVFSETAFYTVTLTAPENLILVTSGSEIDLVRNGDGTLTHSYVAPLMRDFVLLASEHYVSLSGEQDGITLTLFYDERQAGAYDTARAGLRMLKDAVRIYDNIYGPYPFKELDLVETPTSAGGIEYPGVFVVASDQWDKTNDFYEFVIAHECAHEWFYSLVGNDQTLHPWMDEALAQFSVALYIRDLEGDAGYRGALASFQAQYDKYVGQFSSTVQDSMLVIGEPVTAYPQMAYFYLVYQKGPLFFGALAEDYGLDLVIAMLRDYFAAYRYKIAEPGDMLASFEQTSGQDLETIFAEWVGAIPVG